MECVRPPVRAIAEPFITQISIVLITGHALAHTDPMRRLLGRVASLPRSPNAAYGSVTLGALLHRGGPDHRHRPVAG